MRRLLISVFILFGLFPFTSLYYSQRAYSAPPPPEISSDTRKQIEFAILHKAINIRNNMVSVPFYDVEVDNIVLSDEKPWASAWLVFSHPQTGEIIPTEPITALAKWNGYDWDVYLPSDSEWRSMLLESPDDLMSDSNRSALLWMDLKFKDETSDSPIGGYLLPWKGGTTVSLSQSLAHDAYITSGNAHFSFDFYISKTMFDIHAAKAGKVWLFKDDVTNGNPNEVNYLVLQDAENPHLYQLYLHLAQNSIPPELKYVGTTVSQGQFIGIADDTGQSTGHHLHFQVENSPYWSYWGVSVDITFDEVDINGGRPRVTTDIPYCKPDDICDDFQSSYISDNYGSSDPNPPIGSITSPSNGIAVNNNNFYLEGWAFDDAGITSARFKANYENIWKPISSWFSSSNFDYSWDLCADQVPDGPISLALDIQDGGGNWASNMPGLRNIIKNYTCPTPLPECIPNDNQITLFTGPDYTGLCTLFGTGNHTDLGWVGSGNTESIKLGSNVHATLFTNNDFSGRGETFFTDDNYLKDNKVGANTVSSIKVQPSTSLPTSPLPIWPEDGSGFPRDTSLSLVWEDIGGASEYLIDFPGITQTWQIGSVYPIGSLLPGTYNWKVKARNSNGESTWSDSQKLIINDNTTDPASPFTAPFSDGMENGYNGWNPSSNWDQALDQDPAHPGELFWSYEVNSASSGYDNDVPNTGDLTSPAIVIPDDANTYYLRFWYLYETEGPGTIWDQRWLQLSVNGGPFTNLIQLSDDPPNYWLESPTIPLANYAGSTIQVRFHFETLDAAMNDFKGWYIDDFSISSNQPPVCTETGEPNDSPGHAQEINYESAVYAEICPGGDVDYYQFEGLAGDHIGLTTLAQSIGSSLDTYIYLLDSKGSVLAENDDIITYELRDSSLSFILPTTDTYYIKVRAWNHPSAGGDDHTYTLHLANDANDPTAELFTPQDYTFLSKGLEEIIVNASDQGSGISHVDFFWHSGDWQYGSWEYISSDWEGNGGWSTNFDTTLLPDQNNIAFFARVHDWAGNSIGVGTWSLYLYDQSYFTFLPVINK
jgi:hypothetical protein